MTSRSGAGELLGSRVTRLELDLHGHQPHRTPVGLVPKWVYVESNLVRLLIDSYQLPQVLVAFSGSRAFGRTLKGLPQGLGWLSLALNA
jgi:hypothetical protein